MFQATRKAAFEVAHNASKSFPGFFYVTFSSTTKNRSLPNPPLDLDPSLQVLLRDIDMSLKSKDSLRKYKELEIVSGAGSPHVHNLPSEEWSPMDMNDDIHEVEGVSRKSPAALFGSDQIGAVILPQELCSAIDAMISGMFTQFCSLGKRNDAIFVQKARRRSYIVTPNGCFYHLLPRVVMKMCGTHIMTRPTAVESRLHNMQCEMGQHSPVWHYQLTTRQLHQSCTTPS